MSSNFSSVSTRHLCVCFLFIKSPPDISLFTNCELFVCWELVYHNFFPLTFSSRSVYDVGVMQKYTLLRSTPHLDGTHRSLIVTVNKRLIELITAAYCWRIIKKHFQAWTALLAVKHNAFKSSTELITSLNSKCYRPSGILIHRKSSYAPRNRRCVGRPEAQSHEAVNKIKNLPVLQYDLIRGSYCISVLLTFNSSAWEAERIFEKFKKFFCEFNWM
jgi:hypothetical protein